MAAPPPGADVQDGTGPPPQGSPSLEGSLRAPFPAFGDVGGNHVLETGGTHGSSVGPLLQRSAPNSPGPGLPAGKAGLRPRRLAH
jgi:hypothetical protein